MKSILMRCIAGCLLFLLPVSGWSQKTYTLTCQVSGCPPTDSLFLFEFGGVVFHKIASTPPREDGTWVFEMPMTESPRFYYVGNNMASLKPLILGTEPSVRLVGQCVNFRGARVKDSPLNEGYERLKQHINTNKGRMRSLANQYRRTGGDSARIARIDEAIRALDADKLALLDSLKRTSPYLAHVAAFNTYLSYRFYGQAYPDEISYYMAECFKHVDWENKDYEYLPWVYETVKSYATTMSSVNLTPEKHLALFEGLLAQIPEDSRTYKLALGGILAGLQSKNHPNYRYFAKKFIDKYKATDMLSCVEVQRQMRSVQANQIGGEAPDFTMKTPEGEDLSLSDLRGKYVLIDFWASWCGPCRRENPNVVAMYEKYKDKEFEILSVSLDKQKDRWLQAIEKDGLTWRHVSDLKGWQNEAAKTYGVRSIPHTVLVDKEGRIIARNLRGPNLEAKLKEIFGE